MNTRILKIICLLLVMSIILTSCGSATTLTPGNVSDNTESEEFPAEPEIPTIDVTDISEMEKTEEVIDSDPVEENSVDEVPKNENQLTDEQKNSLAMLNYLALLSQEINSSKNSKLFLDSIYDTIVDNLKPDKVNDLTESYLAGMLDTIAKYRMTAVKRERLQYLYDQNKAQSLKTAMPNPIGLLGAVSSLDAKRALLSVVYMAVDSANSYKSYNNELDQAFLQDGWALDDEDANNLHENRKMAFIYMLDIVKEENLKDKEALLTLNETAIKDFVSQKNNDNTAQKVQFFTSEEETYQYFGSYWLTLTDCYFEKGQYQECLDSIQQYIDIKANIFRKDFEYAQILPKVIVAASNVYKNDKEYVAYVSDKLAELEANTSNKDWMLRYFAAQMYLDLYQKTNKAEYLKSAYRLALNNVNYLTIEQKKLNEEYLANIDFLKVSAADKASKEEKNAVKDYNKALENRRETELPPLYEPLIVNCDLLFALSDIANLTDGAKKDIDDILAGVFLSETISSKYSFAKEPANVTASFDKEQVVVPALALFDKVIVKAVVTGDNGEANANFTVKKVTRDKKTSTPRDATFKTKDLSKYKWKEGDTVVVSFFQDNDNKNCILELKFKVVKNTVVVVNTIAFEQE